MILVARIGGISFEVSSIMRLAEGTKDTIGISHCFLQLVSRPFLASINKVHIIRILVCRLKYSVSVRLPNH